MKSYVFLTLTCYLMVNCEGRFTENFTDVASIELFDKHTSKKFIVQLQLHITDGIVHIKNNSLKHNVVNYVHTKLLVSSLNDQQTIFKPVQLRILVIEKKDETGQQTLLVEEEFIEIEGSKVTQLEIQRVTFEPGMEKSTTKISLEESNIHSRPHNKDHHVYFQGGDDGYVCDLRNVKVWYNHLTFMEKICICSGLTLLFLAIVLTCCCVVSKKRSRKRKLKIESQVYNDLAVDIEDGMNSRCGRQKPLVKGFDDFTKEIDMYFEYNNTYDKLPLFEKF